MTDSTNHAIRYQQKEITMKNAAYAKMIIATMEAETKSKAARKRMAEMAIKIGNYDDDAKVVFSDYIKTL